MRNTAFRTSGVTATALMGLATVSTSSIITGWLPGSGLLAEVVAMVIPGVVGAATWLAFTTLLKIEELGLLWSMVSGLLNVFWKKHS